jgi:ribosomal-protein-alanine N-acetyltransferase
MDLQNVKIETPRLLIREFLDKDLSRLVEMTSKPNFKYYCFDGSVEKVRAFLQKSLDTQKAKNAEGKRDDYLLAVVEKESGILIGHVSIERVNLLPGFTHEINFFVDPAYQSKGYGREAAVNMQFFGIEALGMAGYSVTIHPHNVPSLRVATKEGFIVSALTTLKTENGEEPRLVLALDKAEIYKRHANDNPQMILPKRQWPKIAGPK